ncbi:MAG: dCTP deaminase domain-containing protein [Cellulosilyticaceae bacterium]
MLLNPQMIYFAKTKEGAIIPSKREEDGAFDIYACFEESHMILAPHETKMIPTGLASAFSSDYVAILKERGSNGSKGIGQRCGVVDSGYRGEWFVPVTNHNTLPLVILKEGTSFDQVAYPNAIVYPYEKAISQCIMVEVPKLTTTEISYEQLQKFSSERGTGSLGSSGK